MFGQPLTLVNQTVDAWKDVLLADVEAVEKIHPFGQERFMAAGLQHGSFALNGQGDFARAKINRRLPSRGSNVKAALFVFSVPCQSNIPPFPEEGKMGACIVSPNVLEGRGADLQ